MTKRELIDQIMSLNKSAEPDFLAEFDERELREYLRQLKQLQRELKAEELLEPLAVA